MLTSLCLSASIHSQMRLNTHKHTHTLTIAIIPNRHGYSVLWKGTSCCPCLYSRLTLCSLLCFLLYLFPPLICSISLCLCHDESGRSSDRHRAVTRLLREISVSFLPSVLCPPCLPPYLPPSPSPFFSQ